MNAFSLSLSAPESRETGARLALISYISGWS
jgi:hypothetical protein